MSETSLFDPREFFIPDGVTHVCAGGETAPLIMTALGNSFVSTRLDQPIQAMPLVIFNFATSPYANWNALAWGTALLLVLIMLGLSIAARLLLRRRFRERRIGA